MKYIVAICSIILVACNEKDAAQVNEVRPGVRTWTWYYGITDSPMTVVTPPAHALAIVGGNTDFSNQSVTLHNWTDIPVACQSYAQFAYAGQAIILFEPSLNQVLMRTTGPTGGEFTLNYTQSGEYFTVDTLGTFKIVTAPSVMTGDNEATFILLYDDGCATSAMENANFW